jgi:predicted transposase/invertase (TIGR01784 family)
MAVAEYQKLTWNERRQMIAEEKEKARRDKIAMLHYARHEGEAIGEARGRMETGRTMKADGFSTEQIMKYTGLSPDTIAQL